MKTSGYFRMGVWLLAILLFLNGCGKEIAYSDSDSIQLTGERSAEAYTLTHSTVPVYHRVKAKRCKLTEEQVEKAREILAVGEGDRFHYYEDPHSNDASLCFCKSRNITGVTDEDTSAVLMDTSEQDALKKTDELLREIGLFPTGEYVTEVLLVSDTSIVTYYPAFKDVPIIGAGQIEVKVDTQGVYYFYYAWSKIRGGGRAYRESEVCTVQEAVNKFERTLSFAALQESVASSRYVCQVYVCDRQRRICPFRGWFTGEDAYEKMVIYPGWAFSSNAERPLGNVYNRTIKATREK